MSLSQRDRRALTLLLAALFVALVIYLWPQGGGDAAAATGVAGGVEMAERRLEQVRRLAAQVPAKEAQLASLEADLNSWEQGLINSETAPQAQADLLAILRQIGARQNPPLEFAAVNVGQVQMLPGSEHYGEARVTVTFDCTIEQLVNLMADLTAQPPAIVTDEIRISVRNEEDKSIRVQLRVAGAVPRRLVPEQGGMGRF